ncbi:hypothetical protein ABPG75_003744 [Micractinium tetrahymenae]
MAGAAGAAAVVAPEPPVPALAAAHEEQLLVRKILTEQQFGTHVAELTFPSGPVVLTSARVGSVPASSAQAQRAQLLLFAADVGAPASARFLQLCPGFEQPESGTRVVQLQPVITSRVLLRGCYQTVPLSLYGYSLAEAAAAAPPLRQRRLTLAGALQWLRQQQQQQQPEGGQQEGPAAPGPAAGGDGACWQDAPLQPAAKAALAGLVGYWEAVGTSERLMALRPPPCAVFKAAAAVAHAVCGQLVAGTFGLEPVPAPPPAGQQAKEQHTEEPVASQQAAQQPEQQQEQPDQQPKQGAEEEQQMETAEQQNPAAQEQQQGPDAMQVEQPGPEPQAAPVPAPPALPPLPPSPPPSALHGEALLHAAADMVLGWCGMLGKGTLGRTAAAVRCSTAGLAAAVLLCSCGQGAALLLARGGTIMLDDVITMPSAPSSFVRHAITACLLIARSCGTLGGAALLGMWAPPHGITWRSRHWPGQVASTGAVFHASAAEEPDSAAAPGEAALGAAPAAAYGEQDGATLAAAAMAAAAEAVDDEHHGLFSSSPSDDEHEQEGVDAEANAAALAAQQQWQQERAAQLAEVAAELLWGEESEGDEEGAPGYDDAVPLPEDDEGVERAMPQQQQQQQAQAAAATAVAEAEFGTDVFAGPTPPPAQPSPTVQAEAAQAAPANTGEAGEDDLYADLVPVIPQTDGAADSPPRRRRYSDRADPGERWELGAGGSDSSDGERGSRRDRSSDRRKDQNVRREKRKSKERSRERRDVRDDRWRGERSPSRSRSRERAREEEAEGRRRRRQKEEEEEERRRRRRQEEEEEHARRRRRQREEEEERWRRRQAEEEQLRRRQAEEEERVRLRRRQEHEERLRRQREEEEARWRRRHEDERRRRQEEEEALRHRRYQEQQRRLEEEARRAEEDARRRRQQQQADEEARRRGMQQQTDEEAPPRRKRERSPAAAPAFDKQPHKEVDGRQHGQQPAQHGAAPAAAAEPPPDKRRKRGGTTEAAAALLDAAGKWQLHEQQQHDKMTNYWFLKLRSYKGVSAHVAQHLLQGVQPPRLALAARHLLHLLRAHEAAAAFQAAARRLVAAHQVQGSNGAAGMPTPEASVLVGECCASLQQLAELLAKPLPTSGSSGSSAAVPATGADLPPPLLDAVASRRLLPLLAAVLHVPALHRAALEAQLGGASAAQAAVVEAAMAQQLGLGAKALLAELASCRSGRQLLLGQPGVAEALLEATSAGCLAAGWTPVPAAEGAAVLQHSVLAEAAVGQLCAAPLGSEEFAVAADTAAALLCECGPVGRRAVEQALALAAPAAVPRLLLMLRMHCALLRAAAGTGAAAPGLDALSVQVRQYEPNLGLLLEAAPACAPAGPLLLALVAATHPGVLPAWQQQAVAIQVACSAELRMLAALPEPVAAGVGGLGAARAQLAGLKGGVAAVVTAQQARGLASLLTYLGAELPALVTPRGEGPEGGPPPGGDRTVIWHAVEVLFCDPEKLACCEQCLRLMASQLWAAGPAGREAAYTAEGQAGLSVLLRAVLTATELVVASAADDSWQALAGHSIDVGEAAACRRRALSFMEAAAAAMSCMMQHLRGSTCSVKGRSLLAGLLRAHGVLCTQEESLACMLGAGGAEGTAASAAVVAAASGMQAALVARYHLASCLRCYVEAASPWQPPLLQQVFWGSSAPGLEPGQVVAQSPAEMFATACLLGDLFPPEWPAVGRKATQAPPTDRRYRAALATAIEPCGASFRRLISAALTTESRMLRAAVVRVLAHAAGLGGGMGPFLVEPLLEELATVAESPAPVHDARRLLEVIVPLVYRPALKAAMLAAPFTSTLAQLLGVVVGRLSSHEEGGEAAHVCTMAMEAVVVLCNSEVCLDPLAPPKQQQLEDMPSVEEAMPMARVLLEQLPGMGSNALIAHRVLRLMAGADAGRLALRRAVVALHCAASGAEEPSGNPSSVTVAQAAQWMANRYWAAAERLGGSDGGAAAAPGLDGLRSAYVDMVTVMQQICVAVDDGSLPKPLPAQQRFVAALQAALHAAAQAGLDVGGDEHRWEAPGAAHARAADLVYDPATRMFWRNVRARAAAQSQASSAHAMRRFARRECQTDPEVSVATSVHPPLTLPRQPPEQVPLMERPAQQQQAQPKAEPEQQPQQRGRPQQPSPVGTATAATVPAVKAEPQAVAPHAGLPELQALPSVQQSMDLYADLGSGIPGSAASAAAQQLMPGHARASVASVRQVEGRGEEHPQRRPQPQLPEKRPPQQQAEKPQLAQLQVQPKQPPREQQHLEPTSSGSLQALLSNPAALQALLKDPLQLQRLLEKHPALISVLKAALAQNS